MNWEEMNVENEAALLYAQSSAAENWETEERESYDVETLRQEYRDSLYSEKGAALLNERFVEVEA